MQKLHITALNPSTGQARANASVTVYVSGTLTLAGIFADDESTPLDNPLQTDTSGRTAFKAVDGEYDIKVSGSGFSDYTYTKVQLMDKDNYLTTDFEAPLPSHTHQDTTEGGTLDAAAVVSGTFAVARIPFMRPTQQVFTSGGTWNKPSNCIGIEVYCTGGGGGGGSSPASNNTGLGG